MVHFLISNTYLELKIIYKQLISIEKYLEVSVFSQDMFEHIKDN